MSCVLRWALALLVVLPAVSRADDPGAGELPAPAFLASDVELSPQAKLPQGWAPRPVAAPAAGPPAADSAAGRLVDAVRQALKQGGLEASRIPILASELTGPAKASAVVAVVGGDAPSSAAKAIDVLAPLKAGAEKAGWVVRGLGGPARALLVAAPTAARAALHTAAASWAAEGLTTRAQAVFEANDPFGTLAVTAVALELEPRCARAHMLAGDVRWALAFLKRPHGSYPLAAKHQEAALDERAPYPLEPLARAQGRSKLAMTYLYMGGKDEAAYALFTRVVADPLLADWEGTWNDRYNLACAAARLGKQDEAFQQLAAVLARNAQKELAGIEHWREDADFDPLHADPRWAELLKKYPEEE